MPDVDEREDSLELRLKYLARYEKLLRRSQPQAVVEILRRYGRDRIRPGYWTMRMEIV